MRTVTLLDGPKQGEVITVQGNHHHISFAVMDQLQPVRAISDYPTMAKNKILTVDYQIHRVGEYKEVALSNCVVHYCRSGFVGVVNRDTLSEVEGRDCRDLVGQWKLQPRYSFWTQFDRWFEEQRVKHGVPRPNDKHYIELALGVKYESTVCV
jgi:hypothetical protein